MREDLDKVSSFALSRVDRLPGFRFVMDDWENSRLWRKRFELEQAISAFESAGYPGSNIAVDY